MDVATGAIGSLLSKLADLLKLEYRLQTGVKEKVDFLIKELESAQAFLRKIDKVPREQLDEQVKIWADEIKEASCDMEDIIDDFLVRVEDPKPTEKMKFELFEWLLEKFGRLVSKAEARHDIGTAIEQVDKKVKEIAERRQRYKIDDCVVSLATPSSRIDPRIAVVYRTKASLLIGIDEGKDAVINMLSLDDGMSSEKTKVVSLVGFGGVGKTTLAKATYDHLKKKEYKWRPAFVSVGQNPDLVKVFKDILFHLDKDKFKDIHSTQKGPDMLIRELQEFLQDKRYLIVLDDVWETVSRRRILEALIDNDIGSCVQKKNNDIGSSVQKENNDIGSRIIITTRKLEVATGEVYKVQPLSYDNSKKLFYTRIFGGEENCPANERQMVSEVAHKVLRKCGGVPLAIITVASLLVGKTMKEWFDISNSTGFLDKDEEQTEDTKWILSLSYDDLPSHLKTCLLCISVFPEDFMIRKDTLIWIWICEGLINGKPGIELFETGEMYFNDLINRSLIQPVEESKSKNIKGCRVHDMVLDLIRSFSREANFAFISNNCEDAVFGSNPRRLALHNRVVEDIPQDNHIGGGRARSFIAFRCSFGSRLRPQSFKLLPHSFKLLRVLYLEDCHFAFSDHLSQHLTRCDEFVGNLLHLRYLEIFNPSKVEITRKVLLPSSMGALKQLVCLRAFWVLLPVGVLKDLTSLQELHIHPGEDNKSRGQFVKDLGSLHELRVLKINISGMNKSVQSDLWKSLDNLHKLQRLDIGYGDIITLDDEGRNGRLPSCIHPSRLPNLSHLSLRLNLLSDQVLETLGVLPELSYLKLNAGWGKATITGTSAHGYFQKLRTCILGNLMAQFMVNEQDLGVSLTIFYILEYSPAIGSRREQHWCTVARTVMQKLEELYFSIDMHASFPLACNNCFCENLGLECLPSLQEVKAYLYDPGVPDDLVNKEVGALSHAAQVHPNQPTCTIKTWSGSV